MPANIRSYFGNTGPFFITYTVNQFMEGFRNESTYKTFVSNGEEKRFDELFDSAVEEAKANILGKEYPIVINGETLTLNSKITEHSPIDGTLIGTFQKGSRTEASDAINAARKAFRDWSHTPYKERIKIFRNAASIFSRNKFSISAIMSIENGKTRYESVGEVDEAIDFLNYYSDELERNKGYLRKTQMQGSESEMKAGFQGSPGKGEKVVIQMRPYGVFGVIAPFNFPISISVGMSTGALITGNTVVFKPSSTDNMAMLTGFKIYQIFKEAGVPDGVFNYVTGPGSEVGDELVVNKDVDGIAFTGSRKTGLSMLSKSLSLGQQKVYVVEMGGKNPTIVSKSADLDSAVNGVASAAFGYSGQKCSACSRVYVHDSIKEEFITRLVEKTMSFKIGDPLRKENYVGPLISSKALDKYNWAVEEAQKHGKILYGGRQVGASGNGIYVEPTIVEAGQDNVLMHEELFVPFLSVGTFKDMKEALAHANDVEYGLTAGLYSKKRDEIRLFESGIEAGVVYVNRESSATTGAMVGIHTFVGWKGSGLTGKGTGSRNYLQQFMREQSISESK